MLKWTMLFVLLGVAVACAPAAAPTPTPTKAPAPAAATATKPPAEPTKPQMSGHPTTQSPGGMVHSSTLKFEKSTPGDVASGTDQ